MVWKFILACRRRCKGQFDGSLLEMRLGCAHKTFHPLCVHPVSLQNTALFYGDIDCSPSLRFCLHLFRTYLMARFVNDANADADDDALTLVSPLNRTDGPVLSLFKIRTCCLCYWRCVLLHISFWIGTLLCISVKTSYSRPRILLWIVTTLHISIDNSFLRTMSKPNVRHWLGYNSNLCVRVSIHRNQTSKVSGATIFIQLKYWDWKYVTCVFESKLVLHMW